MRSALASLALGLHVLLAACSHATGSEGAAARGHMAGLTGRAPAAGEYLVTVDPDGDAAAIRRAYAGLRFEIVEDLGRGRYLLRFIPDPGLEALERIGQGSETVRGVQPNAVYRPSR